MDLQEEIRDIAGIDEIEYLSEGIVFFKNSKKIGRLAKVINKKREKLLNKGDMASAQALKPLYDEAIKVADAFDKLENEFKSSKGNDKTKIKAKYKEAEVRFKKLLKIAKKDSTKKALLAAGGLAVIAAIMVAAVFGIQSFQASGVLAGAGDNVGARVANFKNAKVPDGAIFNTGNARANIGLGRAAKNIANFANDSKIQQTNKDLMKVAGVAGGVGAGVVSADLIRKLKTAGRNNKTIADTAIALEAIGKVDTKEKESK